MGGYKLYPPFLFVGEGDGFPKMFYRTPINNYIELTLIRLGDSFYFLISLYAANPLTVSRYFWRGWRGESG